MSGSSGAVFVAIIAVNGRYGLGDDFDPIATLKIFRIKMQFTK